MWCLPPPLARLIPFLGAPGAPVGTRLSEARPARSALARQIGRDQRALRRYVVIDTSPNGRWSTISYSPGGMRTRSPRSVRRLHSNTGNSVSPMARSV
jgi:hypothetical protein